MNTFEENNREAHKHLDPAVINIDQSRMTTEDANHFIEVLRDAGVKGSAAGVALRNLCLRLSESDAQTKIRSLGVNALSEDGKIRQITEIMLDLKKALVDLNREDQISFCKELFGEVSLPAVMALLNEPLIQSK